MHGRSLILALIIASMSGIAVIPSDRASGPKIGVPPWPAAVGGSEPLDCDEAAYAYIGHRSPEQRHVSGPHRKQAPD